MSIIMKKGNREFECGEKDKERFKAQGYCVVDEDGVPTERDAAETDFVAENAKLQKNLEETLLENAELKTSLDGSLVECEKLKAEIEALKEKGKKQNK